MVDFKMSLKFIKERGLKCKRTNCKGIIKKKIFQIDQLFFVIIVKNN